MVCLNDIFSIIVIVLDVNSLSWLFVVYFDCLICLMVMGSVFQMVIFVLMVMDIFGCIVIVQVVVFVDDCVFVFCLGNDVFGFSMMKVFFNLVIYEVNVFILL